ncbi:SU10 major capsid protein [Saccharothrix isguenensis]
MTRKSYREETRTVDGVAVTTIETDFGRLPIMLNLYMPTGTVQAVGLDQCPR